MGETRPSHLVLTKNRIEHGRDSAESSYFNGLIGGSNLKQLVFIFK